MNYTLHQLEIFHRIADFKSVTRASEELFLTQPAVSIQSKNLSNVAKHLVEHIEENKAEIMKNHFDWFMKY